MPQISLECNKMVEDRASKMICPIELEYHGEIANESGSVDVQYHLVLMNAAARADPDAALCTVMVVGAGLPVIFLLPRLAPCL
jgi:hypothetical protein